MRAGRPVAPLAAALLLGALAAPAWALGISGSTLTLEECVEIGLRQNPAVEAARGGLASARGRVVEARAGWYPAVRLSAAYTHTTTSGAAMAAPEESFDNRLSLKQTLYDGGLAAGAAEAARHGVASQEAELDRTDLDVALGVRTAFYEALRRRDFVDIARAALQSAGRHVEQAQALYREGSAPRADVIKAEVQASNAQLELIRAENAVLLARAGLAAAMGQPVTTDFALSGPGDGDGGPAPTLEEARAAALEHRPELRAARARVAAADAGVRQARAGFRPTAGLDASYGWQEDEFVPGDPKWSLAVSVTLPLFDRRVAAARVGRAGAERDALRAAETLAQRAVELEVQQAWLSLAEARERRAVSEKILEQAQEDLRVSEGRYHEGLGTILEVIDARTALTRAATGEVIARYDSAQARARLDRAVGAGVTEESR